MTALTDLLGACYRSMTGLRKKTDPANPRAVLRAAIAADPAMRAEAAAELVRVSAIQPERCFVSRTERSILETALGEGNG